jgi:hypothetical protein
LNQIYIDNFWIIFWIWNQIFIFLIYSNT